MDLLTVQETATMLKLSPITIRRYIASGRLPAVRVGRAVRLRREAVEAFLTPAVSEPRGEEAPTIEGRPLTFDDPLWDLVGMVDDPDGPTDVSANKHKYLAEAYADLHDDR